MLLFATILGACISIWLGVAPKVEAEAGYFVALLPMFLLGTGASWLVLMFGRKFFISRKPNNG